MAVKLDISKVSNLVGSIKDGETTVVSLSAAVHSDTGVATNYSETITNSNLYYSNLAAIRTEVDNFRAEMRKLEDETLAKAKEEPEEVPAEPEEEEPVV